MRWKRLRTYSSAPARRGWSYCLHQSVLLPRQAPSYSFRCRPLVGFSCFSAILTPSHNLPNILPLCFLGVASKSAFHDAQRCWHDFQRRVSVQVYMCVCVCVNMTRKHWCFTLDFPTGCVIGGEGARAPVPSSGSMWALWQQAGQLLNHTCLYPSPLHKYGGGQNRGAAPSHKCQRCCQ